jgi:predicted DNA-binding transcriptional regulator AlpA
MTQLWTVTVVMATDEPIPNDVLITMGEAAEQWDEVVLSARGLDGPGFRLTMNMTGVPSAAVDEAIRCARKAADLMDLRADLVEASLATPEVFEMHALRPDTPELVAAPDVAEFLGVSRQRVHQLATRHPQFPAPFIRLSTGPVWTLPAIEHFADIWDRKPGRQAAEDPARSRPAISVEREPVSP